MKLPTLIALLTLSIAPAAFAETAPELIAFLPKVTDRIKTQLKESQVTVPSRVTVNFQIDNQGRVSRITKKLSSGDRLIDGQVLKCIKACQPYPQLPIGRGVVLKSLKLDVFVDPESVRAIYNPSF